MKLSVYNFRGIVSAVIELSKITLLAGKNGAGKSSIVAALSALIAGAQKPSWCTKKDAQQLVYNGSKTGVISLENDSYSASITYPEIKATSQGTPVLSSEIAVGLNNPCLMSEKDRAAFFAGLLKTEPTKEQLTESLKDIEINIDKLWGTIQSLGWEAAYKQASEKGAEYKGAWTYITGEHYGAEKGANWVPKLFDIGYDTEAAKIKLSSLKARRDEIIKSQGANEAKTEADINKIAELENIIAERPAIEERINKNKSELSLVAEKIKNYNLNSVPPVKSESQPCPACGAALNIKNGIIIKGETINKAENDAIERAYNRVIAEIKKLEARKEELNRLVYEDEQAIIVCDLKRNELETLKSKPDTSTEPVNTEAIDNQIAELEAHIAAEQAYRDAFSYHEKITRNKTIVSALAPDGLRMTALKSGLDKFNAELEWMSEKAKYEKIKLTPELEITFGERNYRLLSESEKYRVRAIIQIAVAILDGSQFMIFDGADILDKAGRNGLFRVLSSYEMIPSLICMTIDNEELMPDFSKAGGNSYWVEGGVIDMAAREA